MSSSDGKDGDPIDRASEVLGDLQKGAKFGTLNYKLSLPTAGNNLVNVIDKTRGAIKNGTPRGEWIVRFDKPHAGAAFEHININPKVTGIPDPHLQISPSQLKGAQTAGKVCKVANKVLLPAAIVIDTVRLGSGIHSDIKRGTSRNTVTTAASIAGGWSGGFGGATGGAALGTAIFPGIGTIIGGIVGGISGGIGGSMVSEKVVGAIGDETGWDIEELRCKNCKNWYKCRKYTNQSRNYCPKCSSE